MRPMVIEERANMSKAMEFEISPIQSLKTRICHSGLCRGERDSASVRLVLVFYPLWR